MSAANVSAEAEARRRSTAIQQLRITIDMALDTLARARRDLDADQLSAARDHVWSAGKTLAAAASLGLTK